MAAMSNPMQPTPGGGGAGPLPAHAAMNPASAAAAAAAASAHSNPDLDKQRVALILDINSHLLETIQALQASGKGGDVQSQSNASAPGSASPDGSGAGAEHKKPSREYVEPLRRMQANLAYLASLAERHQKPNATPSNAPPWPQIMTAPPGDEKLAAMYNRLQSLFPQWKVHQQQMLQAAQARQAASGAQHLQQAGAMPVPNAMVAAHAPGSVGPAAGDTTNMG
ncbi:uncharacterized protein PV09_03388 [Verruconis gallopava]|uniref:Uncharacterized protein n=1 Tax=Verruconis gallopava TaxID=253628 RepID=A0A0D2AG84_9PEZI|nr:uncharacterized protein PV09_03388 [Verruconis gallopava]KIW05505.1 hypothetical protein PV09_03388 [Verruconis gallopava]